MTRNAKSTVLAAHWPAKPTSSESQQCEHVSGELIAWPTRLAHMETLRRSYAVTQLRRPGIPGTVASTTRSLRLCDSTYSLHTLTHSLTKIMAKLDPLGFMTRLSRSVYMYRPTVAAATTSRTSTPTPGAPATTANAPKLILLATWMGAQDPYVAKYIQPYRDLYPTSPILLVRSEMRHFLIPGSGIKDILPALAAQRAAFQTRITASDAGEAVISSAGKNEPEMLVHTWSNGGNNTFATLRRLWAKSTDAPFPAHTLVMDSAPGKFGFKATYTAFSAGLPPLLRAILSPILYAMVSWFWLLNSIHRLRYNGSDGGPLEVLAKSFNPPKAQNPWNEIRRTYIYSPEDRLVSYRDVEAHAADAEKKGYEVRTERFDGTGHVAHMRKDPKRYWEIVTETWDQES